MANAKLTTQHIKALAERHLSEAGVSFDFSEFNNYLFLPAFLDVHVHFREPGFFYKESIATGSQAAAHGGYGAVCTPFAAASDIHPSANLSGGGRNGTSNTV